VRRQVLLQHLAVSPDGAWAAYSRRTVERGKYRSRLWRVSLDGGRPEQLTFADANDLNPAFSPDGETLAFLSDRSEERMHPWLLPLGAGEPRQAAELEVAGSPRWSPDGRTLLVLARSGEDRFLVGPREDPLARRIHDLTWRLDGAGLRDQFTAVWAVPAGRGRPRRVTGAGYEVSDAAWSPDGRSIGFLADLGDEAGIQELPQGWSVAPRGGRPRALAKLKGFVWAFAWSPGGHLAVIGVDRPDPVGWENPNLYVVERGRPRQLGAELDRPAMGHTFSDVLDISGILAPTLGWLDDETVVALVADRGEAHPHRFPLDGPPERLVERELVCSRVAVGGGRIVVLAAEPGKAGELYAVEDGEARPLTRHGSGWLSRHRTNPDRVSIRQSRGPAIDAWLQPARGRRRRGPLVLKIHGGPHSAYGPVPFTETLALADAGFHVLYTNPSGSVGYGEDFARALTGRWGEVDSPEQLRAIDWAVREGIADRDRIGVLGLSYGGFMVNWLLGHFPGRFAAGVSENPVTELVSHFGTCDFATWVGQAAVGARFPHEDWEGFRKRSPAALIHRNKAPLLLLQCEGDLRCPPDQSEIVFGILRGLGREVELVRYPEESHILVATGRPDRRVDRLERIVDWFQRYL
jgi:dipeptidyl aminopeptidase/acylaminoacyl peptidase